MNETCHTFGRVILHINEPRHEPLGSIIFYFFSDRMYSRTDLTYPLTDTYNANPRTPSRTGPYTGTYDAEVMSHI